MKNPKCMIEKDKHVYVEECIEAFGSIQDSFDSMQHEKKSLICTELGCCTFLTDNDE